MENQLLVKDMILGFNEWMREYIDDPEAFEHTLTSVQKFFEDSANDEEPSYGHNCAELLIRYAAQAKE